MEFVKCSKGHYYDPNVTSFCPQCAAEAQGNMPFSEDVGATQPVSLRRTMVLRCRWDRRETMGVLCPFPLPEIMAPQSPSVSEEVPSWPAAMLVQHYR